MDFTLSDAQKNEIHLRYDISSLIQRIKDSVEITDEGIYFKTDYYLTINETCEFSQLQMMYCYPEDTVFVSDSLIKACFATGDSVSQVKISIATIPFAGKIESCEASSGVTDPSPVNTLSNTDYGFQTCEMIKIFNTEFYLPYPLIYYKPTNQANRP